MAFVLSARRRAVVRKAVNKLRVSRRAVAIAYLGGACTKCGGLEHLEFHHRDDGSKIANVSKLWTRRPEIIWREVDKCILLCHGCHFEVTYYGDNGGHV